MSNLSPSSSRAIIVTGASTGIGRAAALWMDARGFQVFAGVRKDADADALREAASDRLTPIQLDVTKKESIQSAATTVDEILGDAPLWGIVNNAGIAVGGPLELIDVDELRWQFEVNVFGLVQTTQAFLPAIRRGQGGRVVNIGSAGGKVVTPFMAPYNASKFAVEAITDSMRQEMRPWDIYASCVEPGAIKTEIWGKGEDTIDQVAENLGERGTELYGHIIAAFAKKIGKMQDIAAPVDLVSRAVEHALIAKRPKTRYVVGKDARTGIFLRWLLPDVAMDAFIRKVNGLP
jgi:NAD(P)-dependent dehydrogenase (short-subunit alcohol dehydrogenase family)